MVALPDLSIVFAGLKYGLIGVVVFLAFYIYTKFKYILVVWDCTDKGGRKICDLGLARKIKPKDKTARFQRLLKRKDFIPAPEESAISVLMGGRFMVQYMKTIEEDYVPIEPPDAVSKSLSSFQSVDRQIYVMEEKDRIAKKHTWKQALLQLAPLMIMAMLIICGMIFFDRVAGPIVQIQDNQMARDREITGLIHEVNVLTENVYRLKQGQEPIDIPKNLNEEETT